METQLFKCFIASPSDVQAERNACDSILDEVNKNIGSIQGFRIETVKWEKDAVPAFASDGQEVINEQLDPGGHAFFIGIFWKRFGNPTNRAESGTVEEFNQAYENWKKTGTPNIQIYFNNSPIPPSEISTDDLEKINNFKKTVSEKGGLYTTYSCDFSIYF